MKSSTLTSTEKNKKQLRLKFSMTDITNDDFDDEDEERWQVLFSTESELQTFTLKALKNIIFYKRITVKDNDQLQDRRYFCTLVLMVIKDGFNFCLEKTLNSHRQCGIARKSIFVEKFSIYHFTALILDIFAYFFSYYKSVSTFYISTLL